MRDEIVSENDIFLNGLTLPNDRPSPRRLAKARQVRPPACGFSATSRRHSRREGTPKSAPALHATKGLTFEGSTKMSAIGMSAATRGKGFAISAYADVRHELLFFERQQSLTLRNMEWEDRVKPLVPWSTLIMRGVGVAIIASAILGMLI